MGYYLWKSQTPQQILLQFLLNSLDDKLLFKFEGKSTDGMVGLRVLNTRVTSAAFPPLTLKVKILGPDGAEVVPFSILGIRSGDVGLPSLSDFPRAIRQDILVNHTAPRPQGLFGQDSTTTHSPVCDGLDPAGMVVDFTQIPDPAIPGVAVHLLAGTVSAAIGENDAAGVTLPLANGVWFWIWAPDKRSSMAKVDFMVFSPAGNYTVAVSNTHYAGTFTPVGGTLSGTQSFELTGTNLTSARFVMVTALSSVTVTLDAVKALNAFIDEVVSYPCGEIE